MSMVRLEVTEDEIQDVLTEIWHKSGYDIDKKDPVLIEYLMHKILLRQFVECQEAELQRFANVILPYLKESDARFEAKKLEFTEYAETMQKSILKSLSEDYCKAINSTIRQGSDTVSNNVRSIVGYLQDEKREIVNCIEKERLAFQQAAERYERWLSWMLLGFLGVCGFSLFIAGVMLKFFWWQ